MPRRYFRSKRLELPIEKYLVGWALKQGVEAIKMNTQGHSNLPDRMFLIPGGRPLFIEFKAPGKEPTPVQAHTMQGLRERGYDVEACDNRDDGKKLIQGCIDQAHSRTEKEVDTKSLPNPRRKSVSKKQVPSNLG